MSDHEFEKKVQQRMDDLKLRPSEAVWAEVEKNLRREKRRRRTLLWLPILGVLLTAGGYLIYSGTGKSNNGSLVNNQQTDEYIAPSVGGAPASGSAPAKQPASSSTVKTNPSVSDNSTSFTPSADQPVSAEKNNTLKAQVNKSKDNASQSIAEIIRKQPGAKKSKNTTPDDDRAITDREPGRAEKNNKNDMNIPVRKEPGQKAVVAGKDSLKAPIDSNAVVYSTMKPAAPLAIDRSYYTIHVERESAPVPPAAFALKGVLRSPAYPVASKWQWGVTAGGSVSNISEGGLFELMKSVRVEDLTNSSPTFNGIPPAPTPVSSPIEPGAAFSAGAFVQRAISKRLILSAGLQYSYWSVNTRVGRKVDSVRAVNYSNFGQQLAGSYYRADMELRDYTYRYHFVELPVSLGFRLNRSKRTPLLLEGGISLSRLVHTSALHFDGISGVYYENDDFFNNLQVGLSTGMKIGILQHSKNPVWVGPHLRYFATGLLKSDISPSGSQNLWSFGVNAKMLLKK